MELRQLKNIFEEFQGNYGNSFCLKLFDEILRNENNSTLESAEKFDVSFSGDSLDEMSKGKNIVLGVIVMQTKE